MYKTDTKNEAKRLRAITFDNAITIIWRLDVRIIFSPSVCMRLSV